MINLINNDDYMHITILYMMKIEYLLTDKITDSYVEIITIDIDSIIQSCITLNEKAALEQYSLIISLMMYI